jgi:hypothetical protein
VDETETAVDCAGDFSTLEILCDIHGWRKVVIVKSWMRMSLVSRDAVQS